ncbi:hypothetical protein T09_6609 [Trichinella sp. T9]|nr:hypothetical protein T09_6609 [Trichinella sp. T9]
MEANNDLIQFVTTTKNKQKLVYRDQCYTLKRTDCNDKCWSYGVQQRRVAALPGRLHRNQISIEHFLSAVSYHTPAPYSFNLFLADTY